MLLSNNYANSLSTNTSQASWVSPAITNFQAIEGMIILILLSWCRSTITFQLRCHGYLFALEPHLVLMYEEPGRRLQSESQK